MLLVPVESELLVGSVLRACRLGDVLEPGLRVTEFRRCSAALLTFCWDSRDS